jgi:hypothetical protein
VYDPRSTARNSRTSVRSIRSRRSPGHLEVHRQRSQPPSRRRGICRSSRRGTDGVAGVGGGGDPRPWRGTTRRGHGRFAGHGAALTHHGPGRGRVHGHRRDHRDSPALATAPTTRSTGVPAT